MKNAAPMRASTATAPTTMPAMAPAGNDEPEESDESVAPESAAEDPVAEAPAEVFDTLVDDEVLVGELESSVEDAAADPDAGAEADAAAVSVDSLSRVLVEYGDGFANCAVAVTLLSPMADR